jgi:acetolactate synthase-1/2/3 large subunit
MKLSDYVADFIAEQGVKHVFLISGGAVVHLADSVARHPGLEYICTQHEQAAGAAADAYSRITENLGAVMVTSGPGATNLVTSVCNAYFDSIPVIFLSGQVATFRLKSSERLRQKGFQETDVVSIFRSITKYASLVKDPLDIKYELQKAIHLARTGRPGPVLLDIPDDLQRAEIEPERLRSFSVPEVQRDAGPSLESVVNEVVAHIETSRRPVLIAGAGIRLAKADADLVYFAERFGLPLLLTWGAMDLIPHGYELNMGGLGVCGPRAGNFAAQNADLVLAIGTRLSQMITGGKQDLFAPKAKKIMIDIDPEELGKFGPDTLKLDLAVRGEIARFFEAFRLLPTRPPRDLFGGWRAKIREWAARYPICLPAYYDRGQRVNAYVFVKELSAAAKEGDIIFTDAGGNLSWTMQAFRAKKGQRLISAWNHSPMGYSLPASIGAALASGKEVLCIIGDGGIMMCVEELATIKRYRLPIKVFVFNNRGHGIQKQTLDTWLQSRYVAVDEATGLSFPDFVGLGEAFGLPSVRIESHAELGPKLRKVLDTPGPMLCDVALVEDQKIVPMLKFGAGLEDLDPKIAPEDLAAIMATSAT